MGDEHEGQTELLLDLLERVHDDRLRQNVQCRCRFIEDDKDWIRHQGHGDDRPLAHPP